LNLLKVQLQSAYQQFGRHAGIQKTAALTAPRQLQVAAIYSLALQVYNPPPQPRTYIIAWRRCNSSIITHERINNLTFNKHPSQEAAAF
jgi:hypothetical protein